MQPYCSSALQSFLPVLGQTDSSTLVLLLEATESVLRSGLDQLSTEELQSVITATTDAWRKHAAGQCVKP